MRSWCCGVTFVSGRYWSRARRRTSSICRRRSSKQAVEVFEYYQEKIAECEAEIEKYLERLPHVTEDEPPELPFKRDET